MSYDCRDCTFYGEEKGADYYCEKYGKWYGYSDIEENYDDCSAFSRG